MSGRRPAVVRLLFRFRLEILLAAVVVVLFADYLFSDALLYGSDSIPSGLFFRSLLVDFVRAFGELPKWNPYILGGLPFLDATHGDTFFPSSILHFLMPVYRGMGHKLILHILLAGIFAAFWLRSLRLRPVAVAVGAMAYMLCPIFVSYLFAGQDGKMYVVSLAPLLFGLLERAMRTGSAATFLGLGVAIGVTILSAQIQMAYHAMWYLGALFVVRLAVPASDAGAGAATGAGRGRRVGLFVGAVVVGLLVASVQLFPAVAYVKHPAGFSVRSDRTDYEHATSWSLHPEELVSIVVPEFCNAPRGYWGRNPFKYNSDTAGILVLYLAVLALVRRRDSTRWLLAGISVFAIAYSLGEHTPLHRLFYWVVPQVKLFRAPPLVMFGAALGLAGLAACAIDDLEAERERGRRPPGASRDRALVGGLAAAAALALLGLAAASVASFWNDLVWPQIPPDRLAAQAESLPAFRAGALRAGAVLAIGAGLLRIRRTGALPKAGFVALLLALLVGNLWTVDRRFKVVVDPARFLRPDALVAALRAESADHKFRVMPGTQRYAFNELGVFGVESTLGFHDNELRWYRELRTAPAAEGLLATNASGYPFLRVLGAEYILHDRPDLPNPLRVPDALPRFRLVDAWEVIPDPADIPPRIASDDFDPARTAILEENPGIPPGPPGSGSPGRVAAFEYEGSAVRVRLETTRPALLVHGENWFPYWSATVNGNDAPILRAYGTLRAVAVPAGPSEVTFRFRSSPYETGKLVTLATLLLAGAGGGLAVARRRRGKRGQ